MQTSAGRSGTRDRQVGGARDPGASVTRDRRRARAVRLRPRARLPRRPWTVAVVLTAGSSAAHRRAFGVCDVAAAGHAERSQQSEVGSLKLGRRSDFRLHTSDFTLARDLVTRLYTSAVSLTMRSTVK